MLANWLSKHHSTLYVISLYKPGNMLKQCFKEILKEKEQYQEEEKRKQGRIQEHLYY